MIRIRKSDILMSIVVFVLVWSSILYLSATSFEITEFGILFPSKFNENETMYFDEVVDQIYREKLDNDIENKFWAMNASERETAIRVPSYYYDSSVKTPPIQVYDPRLTIGTYLSAMANGRDKLKSLPFHWYDWVDMSTINKYLLAKKEEKPNCSIVSRYSGRYYDNCCSEDSEIPPEELYHGNKNSLGFNVFTMPYRRVSVEGAIAAAKSYLYTTAPAPRQIVFNSKGGLYDLDLSNTAKEQLLYSNLVHEYIEDQATNHPDSDSTVIDPTVQMEQLMKKRHPTNSPRSMDNIIPIDLTVKSFTFDYNQTIERYESMIARGEELSHNDMKYYESLLHSNHMVETNTVNKYLNEIKVMYVGDEHYDWRFFSGMKIGGYEQQIILHRLIRNWLSFTRKAQLNTWIAHGTLLSWYWNGLSFPWENDVDVQMPLSDLHELARRYNQSMVVENVDEGFGRYFIDITSSITLRERGNGMNNIDARFIDVDTGIYIDITGLAVSGMQAPIKYTGNLADPSVIDPDFENTERYFRTLNTKINVFNCRNGHFTSLDELSPMIPAAIEGEIGFVPAGFTEILSDEYTFGTLKKTFADHIFIPKLRIWVKEEEMFHYLKDPKEWENNFDVKNGLYSNRILPEPKSKANERVTLEQQKEQQEVQANELKYQKYKHFTRYNLSPAGVARVEELSFEELAKFIMKDEIFEAYVTTRDFTSYHGNEIDWIQKTGMNTVPVSLISPPTKHDYFMYNYLLNFGDYEESVAGMLKIVAKYDNDNDTQS